MALYKEHKFSLVRFAKDIGATIGVPEFVDLDAHANIDTLPKCDFLGLSGFALQYDEKLVSVFCAFVASTWDDPDLVRLTEMVDVLADRLEPGKSLPLYTQPGVPAYAMHVANDTAVEPVDRTDLRAIQMVTVRLLSGASGAP